MIYYLGGKQLKVLHKRQRDGNSFQWGELQYDVSEIIYAIFNIGLTILLIRYKKHLDAWKVLEGKAPGYTQRIRKEIVEKAA